MAELQSKHADEPGLYEPKKEEWDVMSDLVKILDQPKKYTKIMSSSEKVTISKYIPFINDVMDRFGNFQAAAADGVVNAGLIEGKSKLDEYALKTNDFQTCCTILDPSFNIKYFEDNIHTHGTTSEIKAMFRKRATEYMHHSREKKMNGSDTEIDELDKIFHKTREIDEIEVYFSLPQVSNSVNPLKWWKDHQDQFPVLSAMARDYLAAPGSSIEPERKFSGARLTLHYTRRSMSNTTIRETQCLKSWKKLIRVIKTRKSKSQFLHR